MVIFAGLNEGWIGLKFDGIGENSFILALMMFEKEIVSISLNLNPCWFIVLIKKTIRLKNIQTQVYDCSGGFCQVIREN